MPQDQAHRAGSGSIFVEGNNEALGLSSGII